MGEGIATFLFLDHLTAVASSLGRGLLADSLQGVRKAGRTIWECVTNGETDVHYECQRQPKSLTNPTRGVPQGQNLV